MYLIFFIQGLIKQLSPHFPSYNKHILLSIENKDILAINSFFAAIFILLYYLYTTNMQTAKHKLAQLSFTQIIYFMIIAFLSVLFIFSIHSNQFVNMFIQMISSIAIILFGIYV